LTISGAPRAPADGSILLDDLLENGQGVGRADGVVTFVTGGLPGERVRVAIDAVKRNYRSGHVTEIEERSPDRVDAGCAVFPRCGGCQTLHLRDEAEREWKRRLVRDALMRIGDLPDVEIAPTVSGTGDGRTGYRNKVTLVCRYHKGAMRLGFFEARSHRLVAIEECPVLLPRLDAAVKSLVRFASEVPAVCEGATHIIARASATGDELVVAFTGPSANRRLGAHTEELRRRLPQLTGIVMTWDLAGENAVFGRRSAVLWGSPVVRERVAGATFSFGIASFFQINTAVLELIAREMLARLAGANRIVDLYCGVGTFSVIAGMHGMATTGVESFALAVGEAAANAAENGLTRSAFECATVADALKAERGATLLAGADAAILDPPRKGCEPEVLAALAASGVGRLLYVSCNPATLARDAKALSSGGFTLGKVTPYDMFPHTGHVEVLAEFTR